MKSFIVLTIVCQFLNIRSKAFAFSSTGVGAYAYQDPYGNRYGGTYTSKDGVVTHKDFNNIGDDTTNSGGNGASLDKNKGGSNLNGYNSRPDVLNNGQGHGANAGFPFNGANPFIPNFNYGLNAFSDVANPHAGANNPAYNDIFTNFFPVYFMNLQRNLQEAFQTSIENQRLAFAAARRAFEQAPKGHPAISAQKDVAGPASSNQGPAPNWFHSQNYNSFSSKTNNPNVAEIAPLSPSPGGPGYSMVQSSSYSMSSNVNGREINHKGAETYVDDNGKITHYKVAD